MTTSLPILPAGPAAVGRGNLNQLAAGAGNFSDAVAVTNDRAVAIGSAAVGFATENTTYVDIVVLNTAAVPPTVSVLNTFVVGPGTSPETRAGLAHDVAITPDGSRVVVSQRNFISVFNLTTGALIASLNIGSAVPIGQGINGNGACDPGNSRNSVVVTNDRAVVTARRVGQAGRTWVYIVNLSGAPTVMLEHQMMPSSVPTEEQSPHDLALSPDGSLAFVTADRTVGLYDVSGAAFVNGNLAPNLTRVWGNGPVPSIWDSVEMSNSRAVVLANNVILNPIRYYWFAQVYQIAPTGLTLLHSFSGLDTNLGGDPVWDLALSEDGTVAGIKALIHDVAILDLITPQSTPLWRAGPGGQNSQASGSVPAFMNDAVAITLGYVDHQPAGGGGDSTHRWAVFAGFTQGAPSISRIHFYDLGQPGQPIAIPEVKFVLSDPSNPTTVADLELTASRTQVIARLTSPPDEANPAGGGRDWYRYVSSPPTLVGSGLGGSGVCVGQDDLRESRSVAVSISRHTNPSLMAGWIHIVQALN